MLLIIYYLSNLQCIMRLQGVLFDLWLNIFWSPKNISSWSWREPKCLKYIEMCVNVISFLHKIVTYRIEIRNIYFLFERYLLTLVLLFSHKFAFKTFHFFSYMSLSNHNKCKYSRPCNLWNKLKISVREPSFLTTAKHTPQEFHCSFGIIFQYIFFFFNSYQQFFECIQCAKLISQSMPLSIPTVFSSFLYVWFVWSWDF